MTGQVKEDILCRFSEVGVVFQDGAISFDPFLFEPSELLTTPTTFKYIDVNGIQQSISLDEGSFAFTVCQVPVVLKASGNNQIVIKDESGCTKREQCCLTREESQRVFARDGHIQMIEIFCRLRV